MQRIIENFPEFKKGERNTTKHFNLLEELKRVVDKKKLYDVSEIEQEIVSGPESRTKHMKSILELKEKNELTESEGLRLLLLYALRYENDDKVIQLGRELSSIIPEKKLKIVECLLEYAGKAKRRGDLFKDQNSFANSSKKFFGSIFGEEVKNVLLQHKSWLSGILEQYTKGKLDPMQYPFF